MMTPEDQRWVAEFVTAALDHYDAMLQEVLLKALPQMLAARSRPELQAVLESFSRQAE